MTSLALSGLFLKLVNIMLKRDDTLMLMKFLFNLDWKMSAPASHFPILVRPTVMAKVFLTTKYLLLTLTVERDLGQLPHVGEQGRVIFRGNFFRIYE